MLRLEINSCSGEGSWTTPQSPDRRRTGTYPIRDTSAFLVTAL